MVYLWGTLLTILLLVLLVFVLYLKKEIWLKPSGVYIIFYLLVIFLSPLYHHFYPKNLKFNFYNLDLISNKEFYSVINVYLKMLVLILIGILSTWIFLPDRSAKISTQKIKDFFAKLNPKVLAGFTIALAIAVGIMYYWDYGNLIFERTMYIPESNSTLKTVYKNLLILVAFLAGLLYRTNRSLAIPILIFAVLSGLSLGSRITSLYLMAFFFPILIQSRKIWRLLFFIIPFMIVFFGFNISLRSESELHGLIPYFKTFINNPGQIWKYTFENIYYTIIFGVYVTAETIEKYPTPQLNYLWTYINPMPGKFTDWYDIYKKLRIGVNFPFNMLGEIYHYPIFFIFYYFLLGVYFQFLDYFTYHLLKNQKLISPLLIITLISLFTIFSFEYGFRSSHRYIVYSFILVFVVWFFSKIKPIRWT